MRKDIISSAIGIVVLTLLLGILYPLVITGVSQVAFPGNANGQKVYVNGKLVGSKIIGQQFTDQVINKKTGKPEVDKNGNPVTDPGPAVLPEPPVGDRAAVQRRRHRVLERRPEQHRHRATRSSPTSRRTCRSRSPMTPG